MTNAQKEYAEVLKSWVTEEFASYRELEAYGEQRDIESEWCDLRDGFEIFTNEVISNLVENTMPAGMDRDSPDDIRTHIAGIVKKLKAENTVHARLLAQFLTDFSDDGLVPPGYDPDDETIDLDEPDYYQWLSHMAEVLEETQGE